VFHIAGHQIGGGARPFIIAEVSANHNGSIGNAIKTITEAKRQGAHAVKIQSYTPDTMTIDSERDDFLVKKGPWKGERLYELYKRAQTPFEWHSRLFDHARNIGITLFSTPFDETALELLQSLDAPAIKIASFEMTDLDLVGQAARSGKPLLISTGMANQEEIAETVETVRVNGCKDLLLFHCVSSYPAPTEQSNLRLISSLKRDFAVEVGLSDHTIGTTASIAAVSLGAVAIEKHFILNRSIGGPDAHFSMEPDELRELADETDRAWQSLGTGAYQRSEAEEDSTVFRRSLYFVRDIKKHSKISAEDVRKIRPGYGLPPKMLPFVLGSITTRNIEAGEAVQLKDFIPCNHNN